MTQQLVTLFPGIATRICELLLLSNICRTKQPCTCKCCLGFYLKCLGTEFKQISDCDCDCAHHFYMTLLQSPLYPHPTHPPAYLCTHRCFLMISLCSVSRSSCLVVSDSSSPWRSATKLLSLAFFALFTFDLSSACWVVMSLSSLLISVIRLCRKRRHISVFNEDHQLSCDLN